MPYKDSEKQKAAQRKWYRKNSSQSQAATHAWRLKHKDHLFEYNKKYREKNWDEILDYQRLWRKQINPSANRERMHKRRHNMMRTGLTLVRNSLWQDQIKKSGFKCFYCGKQCTAQSLQQDHVIPLSKNGLHCMENLMPACRSCNASKGNKDAYLWYLSQPFLAINKALLIKQLLLNHGKPQHQEATPSRSLQHRSLEAS
jgi:5-methylcytosine-specific restriction endonuclease McrA